MVARLNEITEFVNYKAPDSYVRGTYLVVQKSVNSISNKIINSIKRISLDKSLDVISDKMKPN